ncbi:ATP-binding protein [Streptosporangium sp. NPDC051022]|uniref:AAA family ATPase n=1 Tax=Streptosporangium sp. NPDC051022 TaxID=3155752 RepID=UPI00344A38A9
MKRVGSTSMLLAFRAENTRSFRDELDFSLEATALAEPGVPREIPWRAGGHPLRLLPAAGLFGANASGKTNLLKALDDLRGHILHSFRAGSPSRRIQRSPFRLDAAVDDSTRFEIDLILDGVRHEYGVRLDDHRVIEEWAYRYPRGRAALLFRRDGDDVELGASNRAKGRATTEVMRPNALFLSAAAAAGHPDLLPIYEWFEGNLLLAEASSRTHRWAFTAQLLHHPETRDLMLSLIRAADLGITDVKTRPLDPQVVERLRRIVEILHGQDEEPEGAGIEIKITELGITLSHRAAGDDVDFDVKDESLGTLVWLGLIGPVVDALARGSVLLADELEASLHPVLVARLVGLFQDPESNPHNAQLIFSSHDVPLLGGAESDRVLGRDQIWFTEKLPDGSTRLYPLSDLGPRKEEAIGRRYLAGRYGAAPIVSHEEFTEIAKHIAESGRG